MKRKVFGFLLVSVFLLFAVSSYAVTFSLSNINNIAKVTAGNSINAPTYATNLTTATMYGGSVITNAGSTVVQTIANLNEVTWTFTVTNWGNATADFDAKVVASNVNPKGGTWAHHFNNVAANLTGISPFGNATFQFVISNVSAASNGAWMSYLVQVSNKSADIGAHAYMGSDGSTWFGGTLGIQTNGSSASNDSYCYLQQGAQTTGNTNKAGYVTAIVSGPVLNIVKSIETVTDPSGLGHTADGFAVPGAYITYRIWVTNSGSAAATSFKVLDTLATQFVSYVGLTSTATNLVLDATASTADDGSGNNLTFTNIGQQLNAGDRAVVRIQVKVK